jgi:predicted nucleic acid-binding protein
VRKHRRIAIDTCAFIYQWEAHPRYSPLTHLMFSSLEEGEFVAVTSTITMTELVVHPYRDQDLQRVNELASLLSTYPNLQWIPATLAIAVLAADIRANHRLATPDALQAATALHANATGLVTNDPIFKRVADLDVLLLDDCV